MTAIILENDSRHRFCILLPYNLQFNLNERFRITFGIGIAAFCLKQLVLSFRFGLQISPQLKYYLLAFDSDQNPD